MNLPVVEVKNLARRWISEKPEAVKARERDEYPKVRIIVS